MSKLNRFISFGAAAGLAFAGFRAVPIVWPVEPLAAFMVSGAVFITALQYLVEAVTGRAA